MMRLFCYYITTTPAFLLFALATGPTIWTPRLTGWPRSCTLSWVAASFETTKVSHKSALMENGSTVVNSHLPWVYLPLSQKQSAVSNLDAVHMDIAFGNCLSVGGFDYALILVNRSTKNNRTFGLKSLNSNNILSALRLFQALAGSLTRCFYCDCFAKLVGTAILEY
jgi:hypothetical protein